jgi:nucleotide-binding universal stress UspA family protein
MQGQEGMKLTKILCPIDFSAGSQRAMRVAVRMAKVADAELVLAYVWYLPPMAYAGELVYPADAVEEMIEDEERGLQTAADEATALGAPRVTSRFLTGVPWEQIVELLRGDPAFDLVVMGTHGRSGLSRFLLGSVAESVVRHAPCPVLTVPDRDHAGTFQHVLCPIDFSECSRHAVDLAAKIVEPGGAGITLLHVLELPVTASGELPITDLIDTLDTHAAKRLEDWATELRAKVSVPVTTRWRIGSPGGQALAILDEQPPFDLVVVGSHGRTGLRRALLGSVAEKIVRHAPCPVLVTHDRS